MKKRALRIGMIFVGLVMLFMLPCMADSVNAETREFDDVCIFLEPGSYITPLHGANIYDSCRNLEFSVNESDNCPINMVALKQWLVWDDTTNKYELIGVNDYVGDTFDCHNKYKCRMQIRMPAKDGDTDLRFKENAALDIGSHYFELKSQSVTGNNVLANFESRDGIFPTYIRVKGIEITEDNMNDVLGDEDAGSSVYYNPDDGYLTLSNADLTFDEKTVAPAFGNTNDVPYMIYAVNTDLEIQLYGNNYISSAGRRLTDYSEIAGIYQTCTDNYWSKMGIGLYIRGRQPKGKSSLTLNLNGFDMNNPDMYLGGIYAKGFATDNCRIDIYGQNAQVFQGITSDCDNCGCFIDDTDLKIDQTNINDVAIGIYNAADKENPVNIWNSDISDENYKADSKTRISMGANQAIGIMSDKVVFENKPKISITAVGASGMALWSDELDLSNNGDNTALVNTLGSEIGRTVWDGKTSLCNSYMYIRMPGLEYTPAKEPTATESGNIAYYYDELYRRYYSDVEGNHRLDEADIILPPTGQSEEEMERVAALTDLNNAVSDAKAVSNADGKYTDDSYQALQTAIESAEALAANENATTEELKAAKNAVEAAKAGLKEKSSGTDPVGPTPEDPDDPTPVDPTPTPVPVVTPTAPAEPAEIVDLSAVKISKPAAAKKAVTVKWKKVSKKNQKKIQGIEIQVATDPDFTNIVKTATAGKKKTSKKLKGLASKQTYYVRIRAYKDTAEGKHVSPWKTKKVKVK